jgi:hypothetical protein
VYQEVQYRKFVNYMEQNQRALTGQPTKKADCPSKKRKADIYAINENCMIVSFKFLVLAITIVVFLVC